MVVNDEFGLEELHAAGWMSLPARTAPGREEVR